MDRKNQKRMPPELSGPVNPAADTRKPSNSGEKQEILDLGLIAEAVSQLGAPSVRITPQEGVSAVNGSNRAIQPVSLTLAPTGGGINGTPPGDAKTRFIPSRISGSVDDFSDALEDPSIQSLIRFTRGRQSVLWSIAKVVCKLVLWCLAVMAVVVLYLTVFDGMRLDDFVRYLRQFAKD